MIATVLAETGKRLLESIILEKGNLGYYALEGNEVVGYVAATVYEKMAWVGPLICQADQVDVAASLLKAVLANLAGLSVYAVLPKKEIALHEHAFIKLVLRKIFVCQGCF